MVNLSYGLWKVPLDDTLCHFTPVCKNDFYCYSELSSHIVSGREMESKELSQEFSNVRVILTEGFFVLLLRFWRKWLNRYKTFKESRVFCMIWPPNRQEQQNGNNLIALKRQQPYEV